MKQLLQSEFNKGGKTYKNVSSPETSGTQSQVTTIVLDGSVLKISKDNGATFLDIVTTQSNTNANEIDGIQSQISTMLSDIETAVTNIANLTSNKTLIKNSGGGFSAGDGASATYGGAVGINATATSGGAVGSDTSVNSGGAVGYAASATTGGAVGSGARAGVGFSGGFNAKAGMDSNGKYIDAIQLGTGENTVAKTLQVYDYKVYDFNKDSLYCRLLNDKTPAVVETVWSGTFANTSGNSLTIPNYSNYDYFIIKGTATGAYTTIVKKLTSEDQSYGIVKKSNSANGIFAFDINVTATGIITFGSAVYYPPNNYTSTDYTDSGYFWINEILGVKICKE